MLIFNGTTYREATPEELAKFDEARRQEEEDQKHRELSSDEVLEILLGGAE